MTDNSKNTLFSYAITVLVLLFVSLTTIVGLYTDYLWFDALNFSALFTIALKAQVGIFFITAISVFIFLTINVFIASKANAKPKKPTVPFRTKSATSSLAYKIASLVSAGVAVFFGFAVSTQWLTILQYLHQAPFSLSDPIFNKNIAFYIFSLPFFLLVWKCVFALLLITALIVAILYIQSFLIKVFTPPKIQDFGPTDAIPVNGFNFNELLASLKKHAIIHLSVLASFLFIALAYRHYLSRFLIMFSEKGIVVGAGYTDVIAYLPIITGIMILAIIISIFFYIWIFFISKQLKKRHILAYVIALYLLVSFVAPTVIPGMVQSLIVSPNEINLERPYIENNIKFTKIAYGLEDVSEKDFIANEKVTRDILDNETQTVDNIRILDWRPLIQTYKQTQEIRLYYDLSGIDIDRYNINDKYTQVMIAPRELDQGQITQNAQTWVNLHMVYTHGYGVVVSPVNEVTEQGLPNYLIQDIPPVNLVGDEKFDIEKPQVYYGEKENNFVLVNTKTPEFDYPKGESNEYIHYDGKGGVTLNTFIKKLAMAIRFGDIKILLSSDITPQSKIMFNRNIHERISKLMPFLALDSDPYLVIHDGRLFWMQDAYTVSNNFPYSQKFSGINYIRNSVKIVVDAYNGDVSFYIVDPTDPIIHTFARIYPKQFKSFGSMPEGLKEHIRYPEDLFKVQSEIYSIYHMNDPTVFYNKEDAWQIPHEVYGVGQRMKVDPYYIIMKLPGEEKEEFVLMTSFTPIRKDNMISWLAARSDGEHYGKLLLYKFPKDKLVYGPLQIEARIDQDSEISQQLTLWSQQGSQVTRGNLLVIPIKDSILYVEPLYIQAETGQLPELKRVLVSDGDNVVMEKDLATALDVLFGKSRLIIAEDTEKQAGLSPTNHAKTYSDKELLAQANEYYDAVLKSMNDGDWVGIGENFDRLGDVLDVLAR